MIEIVAWLAIYNLSVFVFSYIVGRVLFVICVNWLHDRSRCGLNTCKRNLLVGMAIFSLVGDMIYPFWMPESVKEAVYEPTQERSILALVFDPFRIARWIDFVGG